MGIDVSEGLLRELPFRLVLVKNISSPVDTSIPGVTLQELEALPKMSMENSFCPSPVGSFDTHGGSLDLAAHND